MVSSWHSGAARGMRLRCAGLGSSACRLPLPLAALLLAAVALLPIVACATAADTPTPKLSDAALHKILYEEPNAYLQALGNISDTEGSLSRIFLSPAHRRAAGKLRRWMAAAGLRTWADQVANVHGSVPAADPEAAEVWVGSHYDTVHDAGKYDGALGIVAGIAAVKAVLLEAAVAKGLIIPADVDHAVREAAGTGRRLDLPSLLSDPTQIAQLLAAPVRVVAFSDEEGVRFHSTYLGSRAVVGTLLDAGVLGNTDAQGVSVIDALEHAGFDPSPDSLRTAAVPKEKIKSYIEVHLEQGPVLEAAGQPLGLVTAIAGQSRLQAEFTGEQGHAGTVPMKVRKDPLAGAAEVIGLLEQICNGGSRGQPMNHMLAGDASLVCTVGSMAIWPNAGNVIPGHTNFTIDIRSRSDENRKQVIHDMQRVLQSVCARRGLSCRLQLKNEAAAVQSSSEIVRGLADAAAEAQPLVASLLAQQRQGETDHASAAVRVCAATEDSAAANVCSAELTGDSSSSSKNSSSNGKGGSSQAGTGAKLPELVSGAGHDAMVFAEVTRMGMLFVRCRGGVSHSPLEHVSPDDVAAAAATLYRYLRKQLLPSQGQ